MIWIDIVCLVCVLIFILVGLRRGLLKSVFRLCAWVAGIIGAYFSQDLLAETIATNLETNGFTVRLVCICIGFLIPFLIFLFAAHLTKKAVEGTSISRVDRILGAILGIVKAYVVCFIFLSVMHILPVSGDLREARNNSVSYSVYKFSLEAMGFSSKEIDLIDVAEKKASALSKEITNKAVEKAKEEVNQATEEIKNKAEEEAKKVLDEGVKKNVEEAKAKVQEKIKKPRKKKHVPDIEGDEIEYNSEKDIPIDE